MSEINETNVTTNEESTVVEGGRKFELPEGKDVAVIGLAAACAGLAVKGAVDIFNGVKSKMSGKKEDAKTEDQKDKKGFHPVQGLMGKLGYEKKQVVEVKAEENSSESK